MPNTLLRVNPQTGAFEPYQVPAIYQDAFNRINDSHNNELSNVYNSVKVTMPDGSIILASASIDMLRFFRHIGAKLEVPSHQTVQDAGLSPNISLSKLVFDCGGLFDVNTRGGSARQLVFDESLRTDLANLAFPVANMAFASVNLKGQTTSAAFTHEPFKAQVLENFKTTLEIENEKKSYYEAERDGTSTLGEITLAPLGPNLMLFDEYDKHQEIFDGKIPVFITNGGVDGKFADNEHSGATDAFVEALKELHQEYPDQFLTLVGGASEYTPADMGFVTKKIKDAGIPVLAKDFGANHHYNYTRTDGKILPDFEHKSDIFLQQPRQEYSIPEIMHHTKDARQTSIGNCSIGILNSGDKGSNQEIEIMLAKFAERYKANPSLKLKLIVCTDANDLGQGQSRASFVSYLNDTVARLDQTSHIGINDAISIKGCSRAELPNVTKETYKEAILESALAEDHPHSYLAAKTTAAVASTRQAAMSQELV